MCPDCIRHSRGHLSGLQCTLLLCLDRRSVNIESISYGCLPRVFLNDHHTLTHFDSDIFSFDTLSAGSDALKTGFLAIDARIAEGGFKISAHAAPRGKPEYCKHASVR
ncbi:Putative hypothetical protein [Candidatus Hamiltonella defensa (Bemisia tabaci)]|nr:Putative hypothetical protein [Candidatus Hamiltonella defensa (Bemisia tabaci)]